MKILLLPGVDGTSAFFQPLVEHCPAGVTVAPLEYDGCAATSYAELLEHVLAAVPDEDFVVLGWSFSGPLALLLANRGLPRLRGVILAASFVWRPVRVLAPWMKVFARPALFRLYPLASMGQALLSGYSTPELRALQSQAFARAKPQLLAARVRMLLEVDVRRELQACELPILYLQAQADRVIHGGHGRAICELARSARLVELPGPHLSLATHPRESWAAIEAFLSDLGTAASASR